MRDYPIRQIDATHIMTLRDRCLAEGKPGAANNRKKYLSAMFSWALESRRFGLKSNPCRDVKKAQYVSDGFYTWTVEDVQKYVEHHPPGTKAFLALAPMLFLGARRQDACALGPKNIQTTVVDGEPQQTMTYVPRKTSYRRKVASVKPILPPLADALRHTVTGINTFLVTDYGEPFTAAGFGNKMREWCDQAGLPECTAHGLKKAGATICAELGATDRMLMALFDWSSEKVANAYVQKANKTKLAADAAKLLAKIAWRPENKTKNETA
jgi:integrase